MALHIGIDAGGTYTDAVIIDTTDNAVLGSAKAPTTRDNLAAGIGDALDRLDPALCAGAGRVFLSTTLATNACVENKGGDARLIFINADRKAAAWAGADQGLPPLEEIAFLEAEEGGCEAAWRAFCADNPGWIEAADSLAVVQYEASRSGAALEKELRAYLEERYALPVVCGHELFSDLNCLKRGVSTMLNGRLIPVVHEFLQAVRKALEARGIDAPVSIVRSDGTLMSEEFTGVRPVETLLSGPAAGVIGAARLTDAAHCLIVDMGGTTTDISLITDGRPLKVEGGINIGPWHTFVKGVFVDTFGLGGDSAVRLDADRRPALDTRRAIPLSMAAARWPAVTGALARLLEEEPDGNRPPLQEFFVAAGPMRDPARFSGRERALYRAAAEGPLGYREAADMMETDVYSLRVEPLEKAGLIMRCGLTPTDIMHLRGDYAGYDREAARLGAEFAARGAGMTVDALCGAVYDMIREKLYANIVRILLAEQYPALKKQGLAPVWDAVIGDNWIQGGRDADGAACLRPLFHTDYTLVGIGAPIHVFLPEVARRLGTRAVVPDCAGVANALGAAVARVQASHSVDIRPDNSLTGPYTVFAPAAAPVLETREEAVALAAREAREAAGAEARRRGATGELAFETQIEHSEPPTKDGGILYLGSTVTVTAVGMAYLA